MKRLRLNRLLISFVTIAMLYLVFKPETPKEAITIKIQTHDSDYYMQDVVIHQFNAEGNKTNQLMAKRLEHWQIKDLSLLEKPIIISINKTQSANWRITADNGEIINNKKILLKNQVIISELASNQDIETKISTSSLTVDLNNNIAYTDDKTLIENRNYTTRSNSMEVNLNDNLIRLKNQVITEQKNEI